MMTGVMGGLPMLSFVPLVSSAIERQENLVEWVNSWWSDGKAKWLGPEGWYEGVDQQGSFVCYPPPSLKDFALGQLFKFQLKRPETVESLLIVPHLFTSQWRKKEFKAGTFTFTVPSSTMVWGEDQHETLIFVACLPLPSHIPWTM
jgi:hypothetical protein